MTDTSTPIHGLDDLLSVFFKAETPRSDWRIGVEAERFGLLRPAHAPLSYEGSPGVVTLFERLCDRDGWEPKREVRDGPMIALRRDGTSVTLEPGAQVELSGAPHATIHECKTEWDTYLDTVEPIAEELGIDWLSVGFHPFAAREDLGWVPKLRYGVMREYMPTRGKMALDMMLRTCTVQANIDYASEEDAMRKLRVGLRLQPLITAMFANSPWLEGRRSEYRTYRGLVWLHMDPDRSGLLPFAWKDHPRYLDYVEWALDAPMFLFVRNGEVHRNVGQSFRSFMEDGYKGLRPTMGDWLEHLTTLFPEVRLKNTLELRGADAQSRERTFALPALWKGLLYDDQSLAGAEALVDGWGFKDVESQRDRLMRSGVQTKFMNREAVDLAGEVLVLAEEGLRRIADTQDDGNDETVYLAPLRALLEKAQCPADALLARVPDERPSAAAVLEAASA